MTPPLAAGKLTFIAPCAKGGSFPLPPRAGEEESYNFFPFSQLVPSAYSFSSGGPSRPGNSSLIL